MKSRRAQPVFPDGGPKANLGEGPLWVPEQSALYWTDILDRKIFKLHHGEVESFTLDIHVSALAWTGSDLIVAANQGLYRLSADFRAEQLLALPEPEGKTRTNDGGVSPDGEFWIGTMDWTGTDPIGSLYRITPNLSVTRVEAERTIPNSFSWSPDGHHLYHADSAEQTMYQYDFPAMQRGHVSKTPLFSLKGRAQTPDGSCADQDGCLWNAHWGGGQVVRYSPKGEVLTRIDLPVPQPTSCCFGGDDLRTLYITSAREELSEAQLLSAPLSGALFCVEVDTPGLPIPTFKPNTPPET